MATTKVRGEVVDFNPGNPDYILDSTNAVTVINAGGNQYNFNGVYGKFGAKIGTITLTGVPSSHPFALINNGKTSQISYTGSVNEGTATGPDGNTYTFYSGTVTLTVSADFGIISYYCKIHGYMGGQDNLVYTYSESGLKIPTGTNINRPATDVAGMIRNNTNEASEGSASCEEYYNGATWKKLNNIPFPVYFRTVTYTGNGGTQAITGVGFKPDFVWCKTRSTSSDHNVTDSTRGVSKALNPNTTAVEGNQAPNGVTVFSDDGFTVVDNAGGGSSVNGNNITYVAWCWQANGGTTSSNTDGSSTSTVQVNTTAGFSIVQYVGNQTAGHTIGHGLGATPEVVIIKCINVARPWYVYHVGVDATNPADYNLRLNATDARQDSTTEFNDTKPTSTVFTLGTASGPNGTGDDYIAYCFTPIAGYSSFGSYTGDGTTGQAITTVGFELTWVLIKSTVGAANWLLYDTTRGITSGGFLNPDNNDAETADSLSPNITVTATGFTITSGGVTQGLNSNGNLYIYLAFK